MKPKRQMTYSDKYDIVKQHRSGWAEIHCSSCNKLMSYDDSGANAEYDDIQVVCPACFEDKRYV